ncbi:MAG: hypothetical protein MI922_13100 [Bacteroidales bacterium]|nr:hypothetical protein [Bacteroidales bacterium]
MSNIPLYINKIAFSLNVDDPEMLSNFRKEFEGSTIVNVYPLCLASDNISPPV